MADDDIDIEEHDVLDNPVIRSIFPDISVIKKEILQYYDDVPNIKQEPEINTKYEKPQVDQKLQSNADKYESDARRKILPKSKPLEENLDKTQEKKCLRLNKIILGSKPSNTTTVQKNSSEETSRQHAIKPGVRIPKIILQDLGAYIYRNNRYCKDCQTIFPGKSELDNHKKIVHSVKTKQKQINVNVPMKEKTLHQKKSKCNICALYFSSNSNLSRHYKNIHKKKVIFKSKYKNNGSNLVKKQNSQFVSMKNNTRSKSKNTNSGVKHSCFHCKEPFPDHKSLIEHIYEVLEPKRLQRERLRKNITLDKKITLSKHRKGDENNCKTINHQNTLKDKLTFENQDCDLSDSESDKLLPENQDFDENKFKSDTLTLTNKNVEESENEYDKLNENQDFNESELESDNLTIENQGFDASESEHFNVKENNKYNNLKIARNEISSIDKKKKPIENIKDETQNLHLGSGARSLRNRQKFEVNEELNVNEMKVSQTSITGSKKSLTSGITSLQKRQKRKVEYRNPNSKQKYHKSKSASIKRKIESKPGPKSVKKKRIRFEEKLGSVASKKENIEDEFSLKRITRNQYIGPETDTKKQTGAKEKLNSTACEGDIIKDKFRLKRKTPYHQPGSKTIKKKRTVETKVDSPACKNAINEDEFQSNKTIEDDINSKFVYECIYCSYILPTIKAYYAHVVGKHKVEKISEPNKVMFDEQCKYCPSRCINECGRNSHLYKYHYDLVYKHFPLEASDGEKKSTRLKNPAFKMFESFVLESIIYKCNKCDIHFLSSSIAKDHEKHMDLLINWKCSTCSRIFKKHDKHLHLKQHLFSKTLNVCQFNEAELSRLLYNCTKCAIHFTEERYLEHYSKCDEETTDSVYCKNCDILIDKLGYNSHETYHKMGKNITDFTVIVSDIITVTESKEVKVDKKRKRLYEQVNCLTFCPTCKCYLTDVGLTRKTHTESRCSKIVKYTCNLCGLVLTGKAITTHRDHHRKEKGLKVQDFKFFDLKGIQVNPLIPEYPRCSNCEVNFVSKNAVNSHICSETEYLTCSVCNIKLSENAYKLHMNFHNYSISKLKNEKSKAATVVTSELQKPQVESNRQQNSNTNDVDKCELGNTGSTAGDKLTTNIVFSCQSCKIAVETYDKVIEHCQNHFSPVPTMPSTLKICSKCSSKIESDSYENHLKFHVHNETIQFVTYDPMYFTSDNNTWIQHVFASLHRSVQKKVVGESIYKHECRIKMEVVQKGPLHLTVYKCDKCGNFIDPDYLFLHVKYACQNVRKHPCKVCGLPFMSSTFRSNHEKIHRRYNNTRIKSYNIVLINCATHKTYNTSIINAIKHYVLYQCRTCNGVVDKLERNGHRCNVDNLQKCPICRLLIYKDEFDKHVSKHSEITTFNTTNIKVILFGKVESNVKKTQTPSFSGKIYDYTLYKCSKCEVCVNNEILITLHICTTDGSKWKCPRCGFYICALSSHKEHTEMHDRNLEFKTENINVLNFDINRPNNNNLDKTKEEMHHMQDEKGPANKSNEKCSDDNIIKKPNENVVNSDKSCVVEKSKSIALFKCACGLHYMDKLNAALHAKHCNTKLKIMRQKCSKCSLTFNPKELFSHLIAHHGDKNKIYTFEVIEVSAEDDQT